MNIPSDSEHPRPGMNSRINANDRDPTMMKNQPALRTSSGTIWLVMGGLFAAVSLVPFGLLVFSDTSRSRVVALTAGLIVIALYAAIVVVRVAVRPRVLRLRLMAACMLTMAAVALIGAWLCLMIERAPTALS